MIVEHSFVTILEPARAFDRIEGFLGAYGFTRLGQPTPMIRDYSRGKKNTNAAVYLKDIPQKIRVEFDRGRISFAASIDFRRKEDPLLRDFMVSLAIGLDKFLEGQLALAIAHSVIESSAEKVARRDRRHKIARVCAISFALLLVATPVLIGIFMAGSR